MSIFDKLADDLARDTLEVQKASGDDRLFEDLAKEIGASSTTLEELFLTACRVRLAEGRARKFLDRKIAELEAAARAGSDPSGDAR